MDWLMCKARGVSKNLINVGSSQNASATVSANSLANFETDNKKDAVDGKLPSTDSISYPIFINTYYLKQQLPVLSMDTKVFSLSECVQSFPEMDVNEWLSAHAIGLFENVCTLFEALNDMCECPNIRYLNENVMGPKVDSHTVQNLDHVISNLLLSSPSVALPANSSAKQSVGTILSAVHDVIWSKAFPVRCGENFPADITAKISGICKKILICITHFYLAHFQDLEKTDLISHVNTMAKHFFLFTNKYSLIDEKDLEPLNNLPKLLISTEAPLTNPQQYLSKKNSINKEQNEGIVDNDKSQSVDS